jgi:predicted signal transduction protein with EAL and GGDEF domain
MCARLGGDEFGILLADLPDRGAAEDLARRLKVMLEIPFQVFGHEIFASVSIGIAFPDAPPSSDDPIRSADLAMYRAKALGPGSHVVHDPSMDAGPQRFLTLDAQLRRGLERGELRVVYQPIVTLASGKLAGFEALLRWHSATLGDVSPEEFIAIAEETGQIVDLGRFALTEASAALADWRRRTPAANDLFVSVNLSRRQLRRELPAVVAEVLAATGLPPDRLALELTETAIVDDMALAADVLRRLHETGVKLSLDDFGTGWSSLSMLHELPFDTLKIDRSFVKRLERRGIFRRGDLVQTILDLGRTLGLRVVAEGIETQEQAAELKRRRCDMAQGYYFGRALAAADAAVLAGAWPRTRVSQPAIDAA